MIISAMLLSTGCKPRDAKKLALTMAGKPTPVTNCGSNYQGFITLSNDPTSVSGNTTGAQDLYTVCDGEGSPDHVWGFSVSSPTYVHFDLCDDYFGDPSLKIWNTCLGDSDPSAVLWGCNDDYCYLGSGLDVWIDTPGTYYVVVDGHDEGEYGSYTLTGYLNTDY